MIRRVTLASMCAVHPNAPSVITCRRCGRFCCTNCLPQFETCPECVARTTLSIPPLEGRATLAAFGLWATVGLHGAMAALAGAHLATGDLAEDGVLAIADALVAMLYLVVFVTTVVLVCMWFHRATRHALARGASLEVSKPAGAVVSWFIPILNLVRPFNLTRGMLSNAGLDSSSVGAWQAMWVAGNIAANVSGRIEGEAALGIGIVSDLLLVGAGLACAQIVRTLKWPEAALQRPQ